MHAKFRSINRNVSNAGALMEFLHRVFTQCAHHQSIASCCIHATRLYLAFNVTKSTTPFTRFFVTHFAGFRRVGDITVFSDDLFRYCVDLGVARQLSF